MPQSVTPEEAVLAGLRKAVQALPTALVVSGSGGVFPSGAKGKALGQAAIDQGYLELKKEKVQTGNRSKAVEYAIVTDKGLRHVIDSDGPKAALEALLPFVQALGKPPVAPHPEAFRTELARATETCVKAIKESLANLEGKVLQALAPSSAPAVDPSIVLQALQRALERVKTPAVASTADPKDNLAPVPASVLEAEIVAFVDSWAKEKTVGCQFDVLWNHLQKRYPHLTIGAFQDALRKLHDAGRIRLGGWARMLDDIPQPQLALFVSSKVMYHAQPANPNG
jgi:hypothetical protein